MAGAQKRRKKGNEMTERIKKGMTVKDMLTAMSEGNIGAFTLCMRLLENGDKVSPSFLGGATQILSLDSFGIYGKRIWMLFAHVCEHHLGKMIAVLEARQLGEINQQTLNRAIDNYGADLDIDAIVEKVKSHLPNFNLEAAK